MGRDAPLARQALLLLLPLGLAGFAAAQASAQSQGLVVREGSLGNGDLEVGQGIDPLGRSATYLITPEMGERSGRNLFHSFKFFGIGWGETATFTGPDPIDGPQRVSNVIGRVTGGTRSEIDGTLRSTIPGADVWLFNPQGVGIGAGAEIDVPGSFHAGNADSVEFEDGGEPFRAEASPPSVLATAKPSAFGFLPDGKRASLAVEGGLAVTGGEALLVGGDVWLSGVELSAPGGHLGFEASGQVKLTDASLVDVGGEAPGSVSIRGGQVIVQQGTKVLAENTGAGPGGSIAIQASQSLLVDYSLLSVDSSGAGNAGTIQITSPEVTFQNGPGYFHDFGDPTDPRNQSRRIDVGASAATSGSGAGGRIEIEAEISLTLQKGASMSAGSFGSYPSAATGDGGSIHIEAGSLEVLDRSNLTAGAFRSEGNAGTIEIDVDSLRLDGARQEGTPREPGAANYAFIDASKYFNVGPSERLVPGALGTIDIEAGVVEVLNNGVLGADCGACTAKRNPGDPPNISITADTIVVAGGAVRVGTNPGTEGDGGGIEIAAGSLELRKAGSIEAFTRGAGNAGTVTIDAGSLVIGDGGRINAETSATGTSLEDRGGNAGNINLVADSLEIQTGGRITANSRFGGAFGGDAGDIDVTAHDRIFMTNMGGDRFDLDGALKGTITLAGIFSATVGSGGAGGSIRLAAPEITVTEGAIVASSTIGGGAGGTVDLLGDRIRIANGGFVDTTSAPLALPVLAPGGQAGDVTLAGEQWIEVGGVSEFGDVSLVGSRSFGSGDAGAVTLRAPRLLLFDGGKITTDADFAKGGDIAIQAQKLVHLDAGEITASVGGGTGGNITIDPVFVILENGSKIRAEAGSGEGGRIRIRAENFFQFPGSRVSVLSGNPELSGTVEIHSPDVNLAGTLAPLPSVFLDAASLMRERCAARRNGERAGSFSVRGPGGIPSEPDGWLRAPVVLDAPATPTAAAPGPQALVASLPGPLLAHGACP